MKIYILLLLLFVFTACETGTRYEKNSTVENAPTKNSDILNLIENTKSATTLVEASYIEYEDVESDIIIEDSYYVKDKQEFSGGVVTDGLNVKSIRSANHDGYERLVFDSYYWSEHGEKSNKPTNKVGNYKVSYDKNQRVISVVIEGYREFSAKFPTFISQSIIEKIYFDKYLDDSGYKFNIKLKASAKVKVFDLEKPARLVFDIKKI
jgi:hypothetical protein